MPAYQNQTWTSLNCIQHFALNENKLYTAMVYEFEGLTYQP